MSAAAAFASRTAASLETWPAIGLWPHPTPVQSLDRLRLALGGGPRLLIKRDDTIGFGFGGNKVRKLDVVAAAALRAGSDTLITVGGLQSNHARATAFTAARLAMRAILVLNGKAPEQITGNLLLSTLAGAEIRYVATREERQPEMDRIAGQLTAEGGRPFVIPLGASTPVGALAIARALGELLTQMAPPDVIFHASSSGGTQAGLVAGCALAGIDTRVIGISADESSATLATTVRAILRGLADIVGSGPAGTGAEGRIDVDDEYVGGGYAIPTAASREALALVAQSEAILLDPTYTAKAMAGLIEYVREGRIGADETVLFWHTGGQPALFA